MTRAEAQKFLSKGKSLLLRRWWLNDQIPFRKVQWAGVLLILCSLNLLDHLENLSISRLLIYSVVIGFSAQLVFRTWWAYRVLQPAISNQEKCS